MNNFNLRKYLAEGKMVKETTSPDKLTTENNNPELHRLVNRFLLNTAIKYRYTEQDAAYAIMSVLRKRGFEGVDEGTTIETSPEDLAKVKAVAKDDDIIKVTSESIDREFHFTNKTSGHPDPKSLSVPEIEKYIEDNPRTLWGRDLSTWKMVLRSKKEETQGEGSIDESKVPNSEVLDVIDSIQNLIKNIKSADPKGGSNLFTAAGPLVKELHKLVDLTEAELQENIDPAEYAHYLENLRDSGVTNMFGAAPYIERDFGVSRSEARKILATWMKSFNESEIRDEVEAVYETIKESKRLRRSMRHQ